MAKCGQEGIMNTAKVYIVGHRENTSIDSDNWYGGVLLITDMFGRKVKFNFRPSKIKVTVWYLIKNVQWTKKYESAY